MTKCEFSPDETLLITAGADGNIHVYDINSKRIIYKLADHSAPIYSIAIQQHTQDICQSRSDKYIHDNDNNKRDEKNGY